MAEKNTVADSINDAQPDAPAPASAVAPPDASSPASVLLLCQMLLQVQNGLNLLALLLSQMLLNLQGWANLLALQLHRLQRRNLFIIVSILYSYSMKRRGRSLRNTKDPRIVL